VRVLQGAACHSVPGPGSIVSLAVFSDSEEEAELDARQLDLIQLRMDCGVGTFGGDGILYLSVLEMKPLVGDAIQVCEARFCCGCVLRWNVGQRRNARTGTEQKSSQQEHQQAIQVSC